jgi:hypothetical protein
MEENQNAPSERERTNRLLGLSSYAAGVILLGLIAFGIYEEGLTDLGSLGLFVAGAGICFAIGYTTSRKRLS